VVEVVIINISIGNIDRGSSCGSGSGRSNIISSGNKW